ncbi:unnamed protein product, partial [Rotaria sp. Silwood2]
MEDHLADFGALGKMLITPEQNDIVSSALRRSKENNFLYRLISLKVQIERKLVARGSSQTVQQKFS